ncbi:DUF2321 domain-containing protein [Bacillus sp. RG28]|uniref:DUF2321 domain-containing protein n=1 Tax=Gottfriedia endophytica TaxID=2820819 RepID=A0A940NRZ7_9BACI|nr:DUF2321 domain-containing protein [Gottfriedia endophytica]MBP0725947.1 DUF2321 domain-containing protein [Gottfriedia endophytica]
MNNSYYSTAQICLNGHNITARYENRDSRSAEYCSDCGAKTITECTSCKSDIRGFYNVPGVAVLGRKYIVPGYCHNCGQAYPWTEAALIAAKELAEEVENLTPREREILSQSIDDIVSNGPRTVVATTRFKNLASKFVPSIATGFKDILVDVVSESVKKSLWP